MAPKDAIIPIIVSHVKYVSDSDSDSDSVLFFFLRIL
jgi:hypothetical protein